MSYSVLENPMVHTEFWSNNRKSQEHNVDPFPHVEGLPRSRGVFGSAACSALFPGEVDKECFGRILACRADKPCV